MNPLNGILDDFKSIINRIVIKYTYQAEKDETLEKQKYADMYIDALEKNDTFQTYRDYSEKELTDAMVPISIIHMIPRDGWNCIPANYRDILLENRRMNIILNYDEPNEYYRKLNGIPPIDKSEYIFYVPSEYADKLGIDSRIPIHKIQDYYNNIQPGKGDILIGSIESYGIIDNLKKTYPNLEYLNFLGKNRISIYTARKARNFQILSLAQGDLKNILFDKFVQIYEQCRDYFITVIYNTQFRSFIEYYDNFIAMCIMIMTIQQVLSRQLPLVVDREFYNTTGLRMLYEAYNVPYNTNIDDYTQQAIAQSLNMLIQNKATDKVIFDVSKLLGYSDINVYKYYLAREHKMDKYGVPIIKYREIFNNDSGKMETVPDYEAMYDVYFQKVLIGEEDYITSFNNGSINREEYVRVTSEDPFWWEDMNTTKSVWETEYNIIESKYLSLSISYKITDVMYDNILLLKMLIKESEPISSIRFTIPKIAGDQEISLFDAVIILCCLTSKKHHLRGEIISIPSQVLSVLDYLHNTDGESEYLVDSFGFDFDFFKPDNLDGQDLILELASLLLEDDENGEESAKRFLFYIEKLSINSNVTNEEKINAINEIYANIKGLAKFLNYKMSETTDRKTYETLKEFYRTVYYSREVKDVFTINSENPELKRTAKTFFEFLYYHNPYIYSILFSVNMEKQYKEYLESNGLLEVNLSFEDFKKSVEYGNIDIRYSDLNIDNEYVRIHEDLLYYYIDHIISRMETVVKNLKSIYMINDSSSTSLENLLIKMINFFKSFTVDMLGLDILYVCDLKAENILRLFDEVERVRKYIEVPEELRLQYSDVISKTAVSFRSDDYMKLKDCMSSESDITTNEIMKLRDCVHKIWTED